MSDESTTRSYIERLRSLDADRRLEAALALAQVRPSSPEIVLALEHTALSDGDPRVRAAALGALDAPAHQRLQWERLTESQAAPRLPASLLRDEIEAWRKDGLISPQVASLLKQRYPLVEPPVPAPAAPPPPLPPEVAEAAPAPAAALEGSPVNAEPAQPAQRATLSQILLSETAIRVALYLGAFFVVSAAFITAALVEVARLPILSITTVVLLGASWLLSRRLPAAGFALLAAGGLLIPIDVGVLVDLSRMAAPQSYSLWAVAFALCSAVWAAGAWRLDSRLFCLMSLASLDLAVYDALYQWLGVDINLLYLALVGVALGAVLVASAVKGRGATKFFRPLFITAQLQAGLLVMLAFFAALSALFNLEVQRPETWWYRAGTWLVLTVFYIVSDLQVSPILVKLSSATTEVSLFRFAAAYCFLVVPLVAIRAISPTAEIVAAVTWAWGAIFALAGEGLLAVPWDKARGYAASLLTLAVPGMALGILNSPGIEAALGYLAGTAILLTLLSVHRLRWPLWSLALVSWAAAYLTLYALPGIEALHLFVGHILVVAMSILLTLELLLRKRLALARGWTIPLLVAGIVFTVATGVATLFGYENEPGNVAITYLIMAVFLTGYAVLDSRAIFWIAALVVAYLAFVAQVATMDSLHISLGFLYLIPAVVYLVIYTVTRHRMALKPVWWAPTLGFAGLAFGLDVLLTLTETGARTENMALVFLVWTVVLGLYTVLETERAAWWSGALIMAYASYGTASQIDTVRALPVFDGFIQLAPALIFLTINLIAWRRFRASASWTLPPLLLGAVASLVTAVVTIGGAPVQTDRGVAIFTIFALYFAGYSVLSSTRATAFFSAAAVAAAYTYVIAPWQNPALSWATPYTFLGVALYVLGLALAAPFMRRTQILGRPFQLSGLVLGAFASLAAFFSVVGYDAVAGVALAATCVVVEAFNRRNIWLGYPANLLYLISYFLALRQMDVVEPQFFAIGAALLGLIMHYLLVRNKSVAAAFTTGLISQLLLQSTSYVQMVSTQELRFFAALFFESLAIMIYGLVIRSRSLLFIPIGFLIVGTATVAFSFLKGISTAVIIGVTGIVLLGLGILALMMRERLVRLVAILNTWQP